MIQTELLENETAQTRRERFFEGRDLWYEYERVNGYAFEPNRAGIKKLARLLDLKPLYIQRKINYFLQT